VQNGRLGEPAVAWDEPSEQPWHGGEVRHEACRHLEQVALSLVVECLEQASPAVVEFLDLDVAVNEGHGSLLLRPGAKTPCRCCVPN
jgi:hypothetical protein